MEQSITHASRSNSTHSKSMLCDDPLETNDGSKVFELFTGDSLLELCNSFWMRSPGTRKNVQPYLRGCKWSPDGTCCLSVVNHDGFHIMELPRELYQGCPTRDRMITLLPAVIHVKESGLVYDFCWYPKMNSHYPETCSWISTKINSPIQMWDAYDGSLRCSYRGFNAVDEMEPALSVTFINQGQRIVGGYKNCLRTFDVERPGRDFLEHKIKSPASCFATHGSILAVGSWNANIKLFSILNNGTYRSVGSLHAHTGGITHLQFTPDGTKLVSGARKDHNLCVWDIRYHRRPLNILKRSVSTNQRIYFDISTCGRYLISGGTDGVIRVWDHKFIKWTEQFNVTQANQENATFRFQLYRDCCNSISIHPSRPILATGSGQFHFVDPVKALDVECDGDTNCEDGGTVEPISVSNVSSSDEPDLVESADILSTQVQKTNLTDEFEINIKNVSEKTSSEVHITDSTKIFADNPDLLLPKIISQEPSSDLPLAKTPKESNDIISTVVKKINDAETPISISVLETSCITPCNRAHVNEEPPSKRRILNAITQPFRETSDISEISIKENFGIQPKSHIIDKATSKVTKGSLLPPTKKCNLITREQLDDSKLIINDNVDIQFPMNVNKLDEVEVVPIKELNLTRIQELHRNTELGTLSDCNAFDNLPSRVLKVDTDSHFSAKQPKLCEIERSSAKMLKVGLIEKTPDSRCVVDNVLESDDDYNDVNENKMKYSSYAENNLTFWWIAKVFEKQLT